MSERENIICDLIDMIETHGDGYAYNEGVANYILSREAKLKKEIERLGKHGTDAFAEVLKLQSKIERAMDFVRNTPCDNGPNKTECDRCKTLKILSEESINGK